MEIIRGKIPLQMDAPGLSACLAGCRRIHIDLGTGDGRFVRQLAQANPAVFVIGVDACRENLRAVSRVTRANELFVIANAECLPRELYGLAGQLSINFPWGSLLSGLLEAKPALMDGLCAISQPGALLDVRLNAAALAEAGYSFEQGAARVRDNLLWRGFGLRPPAALDARALRSYPSTWARRLAAGRDPRSVVLTSARG